ncbi:MAG TPA: hypothetical protein PLB01_18455, partial [Thermoanaerobaculia bacterium]|nr:hypothetical protein [Thermoanaerobaculia bacterium]
KEGDATAALGTAAKRIKATYDAPFLAHATMEPMGAVADVRPDRYEASLKAYADLEISWLLSGHLPPVAAPAASRVIARAASFPLEGRVPAPGQQALAAALAHAAAAA